MPDLKVLLAPQQALIAAFEALVAWGWLVLDEAQHGTASAVEARAAGVALEVVLGKLRPVVSVEGLADAERLVSLLGEEGGLG